MYGGAEIYKRDQSEKFSRLSMALFYCLYLTKAEKDRRAMMCVKQHIACIHFSMCLSLSVCVCVNAREYICLYRMA